MKISPRYNYGAENFFWLEREPHSDESPRNFQNSKNPRDFHLKPAGELGSLVIYLRFFDTKQHHKPYVHVKYNDDEAVVALNGEMLSGELPVK